MTDHFHEAEQYLRLSDEVSPNSPEASAWYRDRAEVHALLAVVQQLQYQSQVRGDR